MKPVMYLFLNRGLRMSTGKAAAQVAHAAVEAYRISDPAMVEHWYVGGHYTKLVLAAENEGHIWTIAHYLKERDFHHRLIIDEGRTEIRPHSVTAVGVEIVDKDSEYTAATFSEFALYKDPKPPQVTLTLSERAARLLKK